MIEMPQYPFMLEPGDILLYSGKSIWSWTIKVKTWSDISHVEIFLGEGKTFSSREKQGVNIYDFTSENLVVVLRPNDSIDIGKLLTFARAVQGQKYDYWGLLRFFKLGKQSQDKQFCSESVTRACRFAGFKVFAEEYDADLVSPGMFLSSPHCDVVWREKK